MFRSWRAAALAGLIAVVIWTPAALAKPGTRDAFLRAPVNRPLPQQAAAEAEGRGLQISSTEGRLGVPTFVFNSAPSDASLSPARALAPSSADAAARTHLRSVAPLYRLGRSEVDAAELLGVHEPELGATGAVIARYGRRVNGVEVFRSELKVVMDAGHNLVALSGYLAPPTADEARNAQASAFRLSAPEAIAIAASELSGVAVSARALRPAGQSGDYLDYTVDAALTAGLRFPTAPRAKRVLWAMPDTHVPAWYLEVNAGTPDSTDAPYEAFVISARDGSVLLRHELSASEQFTYRVYADPSTGLPHDGPQGTDATPHPTGTPNGYQAPFVASSSVTLQNQPFSRNDPWLPANATHTIGNNVEAYADLGGGDGFQAAFDFHAETTGPRAFDYPFDPNLAPGADRQQRSAAIVNLFYVTNFLHDWFYDVGFDERAGNAQASNFGRGGVERDSLRVEAQDYGGRNNANMSTPADGGRPRMQQYIFDGTPSLAVSAPASLARPYDAYDAAFNKPTYDVAAALELPPTSSDPAENAGLHLGCADANGANPYTGTPFTGKIAVIERGVCSFVYKVLNAQNAGAVGVVITNSATGSLGRMGASGIPAVDNAVIIPSLMISLADGNALRAGIAAGTVNARLQKTPDLDRDGTLDNAIVAHEWGHYLSNRLIGNASGLTNHQGRSLGEGWSDFVSMLLMVREEDRIKPGNNLFQGVYGLAGYTSSGGANQGYYWGIRRVPYSIDLSKNGLTLKHMANGAALPTHHPIASNNPTTNALFHNTGEVWATMLWEGYANLLNAHPFQEAQDRMKRYLVASLKATPSQPTLLEARDALLAVVRAEDPADLQRFAAAFAKRGAGYGAKVAERSSQDHIGVIESYQTGHTLEVVALTLDDSSGPCDRDGILDVGESGVVRITLRNVGASTIPGDAIQLGPVSLGAGASFLVLSQPYFPTLQAGETRSVEAQVQLTGSETTPLTLTLPIQLHAPHAAGTSQIVRTFYVNHDEQAASSTEDTFQTQYTPWTVSHLGAGAPWSQRVENAQRFWHLDNPNGEMDAALVSPSMTAAVGQDFKLSFEHRFSFEAADAQNAFYDGGVLELSIDGGPWRDIFDFERFSDSTTNAGYVYYLDPLNPLGVRPAYVGLLAGFPQFSTVKVDLGRQLEGRSVQFRFRAGSDVAVGAHGWDIRRVAVTGTTAPPFPKRADESAGCNMRPIANAGLSQTVAERMADGALRTIALTAHASFDPNGTAALTYLWTQRGGPAVTLSDATGMAPTFTADVAADALITFELVVGNGTTTSLPSTVQVRVVNSNRAPIALARVQDSGPTTIDERSGSVTLDATGSSDPDGEPLAFTWTQTAGPEVTLDDPTSATPTFAPPEVSADTAFTFRLVADDGDEASAPSDVTVTVRQVDRAPVADAGPSVLVLPSSTVQLRGTVSDEDGDAITSITWTQLQGPTVALEGGDTTTPTFTAPKVSARVTLVFGLSGVANGIASNQGTIEVTVAGENTAPILGGTTRSTVISGAQVTVSASAIDADGDPLTYVWTQVSGPRVTLSGATTEAVSFKAPKVSSDANVVLQVVASDGIATSAPMQATVTVQPAPPDAPKKGGGCSATGNATGALLPALGLMAAMLMRRRRLG